MDTAPVTPGDELTHAYDVVARAEHALAAAQNHFVSAQYAAYCAHPRAGLYLGGMAHDTDVAARAAELSQARGAWDAAYSARHDLHVAEDGCPVCGPRPYSLHSAQATPAQMAAAATNPQTAAALAPYLDRP